MSTLFPPVIDDLLTIQESSARDTDPRSDRGGNQFGFNPR
ncbi:hypothetical protein KOR42_41620 [Thalassoglobus neptunius]|uniref:Uncharacterized protein n=1 Tax=Thalassoglobus neptunius TaxID=1938619 RepID=A0A5C5W972_9PLAN|nr:hypothetical protein KOR42_41620 [Thalassoglobus neptunius]